MEVVYEKNRVRYYNTRINKATQIMEEYKRIFSYCVVNNLYHDNIIYVAKQIVILRKVSRRATRRLYERYNMRMSA